MTAPSSPANRIFILGSCVSRDAFRLPEHGIDLVGYIARTSLASAFQSHPAPPSMFAAAKRIQSSFQRRMVEMDLGKRATETLQRTAYDLVLLDLIDERFNLARFGGSSRAPALITLSAEFKKVCRWSGLTVAPGTTQHLIAWKLGVRELFRTVPPSRIVVNRAYWASHLEDGTPLPDQELIAANNALLETMYGFLQRNGVRHVIGYPDGFAAAASHHWGTAPFHYVESVYRHMLEELTQVLATVSSPDIPADFQKENYQ